MAIRRTAARILKTLVFVVGALFIAAMAHEAVHFVQIAVNSSVVKPTAFVINLAPNEHNTSFASVEWGWREGATQEQALAFMAGLWGWEALAYTIFFVVLGAIIFALRKDFVR